MMKQDVFQFKAFGVYHQNAGLKVTTEACLFGGWAAAMMMKQQPSTVLDVGAGTGLLGLISAQSINASITAIEPSPADLQICRRNFKHAPWQKRLKALPDTLQSFSAKSTNQYDAIICNPPFFANSLLSPNTRRNKALHESDLTIPVMLQSFRKLLQPDGKIYLLLPANREWVQEVKKESLHTEMITHIKQTPLHDPFRVFVVLSFAEQLPLKESTIEIKNASGNYSDEFVMLLKNYYLNL